MKQKLTKPLFLLAAAVAILPLTTQAQLIISEVDANGSSGSTGYGADWFELKNIGSTTIDITGWKMDDNSASFASAVSIRGITSIAPGLAVVFLEGNATGTTDATINANFISAWFGASAPSGLLVGNYGGSGVGLGSFEAGDAVNIFDSTGTLMASVSFGASITGPTFDNAAGLNNTTISQTSVAGKKVNGAFLFIQWSGNGFSRRCRPRSRTHHTGLGWCRSGCFVGLPSAQSEIIPFTSQNTRGPSCACFIFWRQLVVR